VSLPLIRQGLVLSRTELGASKMKLSYLQHSTIVYVFERALAVFMCAHIATALKVCVKERVCTILHVFVCIYSLCV